MSTPGLFTWATIVISIKAITRSNSSIHGSMRNRHEGTQPGNKINHWNNQWLNLWGNYWNTIGVTFFTRASKWPFWNDVCCITPIFLTWSCWSPEDIQTLSHRRLALALPCKEVIVCSGLSFSPVNDFSPTWIILLQLLTYLYYSLWVFQLSQV